MPFKIVISYDKMYKEYRIIAQNDANYESWTLFQSSDWDVIKCQRDQFLRLFGVDNIQLINPEEAPQ